MLNDNNKRYINLAIECLRNKNIKDAIIYINKVIDDLKGTNTDLEDIENVVAYYDLKNIDNNKTKTNTIIDKISNNNNISIDNMDYTYGNANGYTGWTNLGLQLSNPNSLVNMDYVNCKSVEINFNSLNYFFRHNMFILALIDDENNEYILKSLCWGRLAAYIYNKTDDTELVGMSINQSQTFEEGDYNFHSAILSFENNGIQTYVDGQKQVFTNIGKNIVGAKLYTSDKYYTDMPYRSLKFYNYNQTEETALKNYNTFIKHINTTGYEDKPYSSQTEFNTLDDLLNSNLELGSKVSTKGYLTVGDNGGAKYNIVNYDTYFNSLDETSKYISRNNSNTSKCDVDGFGNHYMKNGYIAMLDLEQEFFTPEMFGAKGDGLSNDTEPFINLFGIVKKGNINFKENATYMIGSRKAQEKSYGVDNKYVYPLMGSFDGGCHRPLIAECTKGLIIDGKGATLKVPENDFGYGMGMICLGGVVKNLEWKNTIFDGNGLSMVSTSVTGEKNKTSAHSICYAPGGKRISDKMAEFSYINFHHNKFLANGTIIDIQDQGGDDFLIINPLISTDVYIEDNEFYNWGRWVLSVDLGGSGERFYNWKFNRNICKQDENNCYDSYGTTKYRGMGWIDFEARKTWSNLEVCGNTVEGLECFSINGNGKPIYGLKLNNNNITRLERAYRSAYSYFLNCGHVTHMHDVEINDNIFNTLNSITLGQEYTDNFTVKNNQMKNAVIVNGLQGECIVDNNINPDKDVILRITNHHLPPLVDGEVCNFVFTNNEGSIAGIKSKGAYLNNLDGSLDYLNVTIENNKMANTWIEGIGHEWSIDPTQFTKPVDCIAKGFYFTKPTQFNPINTPVLGCGKYKTGELIVENVRMSRLNLCYYYNKYITENKTYNIYCEETGYLPKTYADKYFSQELGKSVLVGNYVFTDTNLYYVLTAGTLGDEVIENEGEFTSGTAVLKFVDKIAKIRVEEIG